MPITTQCSGCGQTLAVAEEFAGRKAKCPQCGHVYIVPTAATGPTSDNGATAAVIGASDAFPSPDMTASYAPSTAAGAARDAQYWMRASDGRTYGPVDQPGLMRWFAEGRVGPDYQIRTGSEGPWQPAALFQGMRSAAPPGRSPQPAAGHPFAGNPYAQNPYAASPVAAQAYPQGQSPTTWRKDDRGSLVLVLGILAWIFGCPIFSIIAWTVGHQAIRDIRDGLANPASLGMVQVGYYLAMAHVIVTLLAIGFMAVIFAVALVSG
jgi:phage FluMu protein Com